MESINKMAEEAGSGLVEVVRDRLNKVKQALLMRSNVDKTLKVEDAYAVSEIDSLLNRLRGMFLDATEEKHLTTAEKERAPS
jgi:anaerobic ribonucleoside-triphosphate reductase